MEGRKGVRRAAHRGGHGDLGVDGGGGRTDYTVWEERRGYFMVGKSREAVIVGGGDEPGKLWIRK